jgi:hypothetical protein
MDCKTARVLLLFSRPLAAELEAGDAEALESHLAECPECAPLARAERRQDDRIGRVLRDVPVPPELRGRLLARLDAQRGAWYRRWSAGVLATAAAVVLVVGLAWNWLGRGTVIGLQAFHADVSQQQGARAELVEQWFHDKYGIRTTAPGDFSYHLLASYHLADLEGRAVPFLLFLHEGEYAQVFLLRDDQFNLPALLDQQRAESGGLAVEVRPHLTDPHVAYLVRYTGGSLRRFLSDRPRPQT